jgi:ligand-binding sensor domain-containing protein
LAVFDGRSGEMLRQFQSYDFPDRHGNIIRVSGLLRDRRGAIWMGSNKGCWRVAAVHATPEALIDLPRTSQVWFTEDPVRDTVWALLGEPEPTGLGRLVALDPSGRPTGATVPLTVQPSCAAVMDREGSLWIGGRDGLTQLRPLPVESFRLPGVFARYPLQAVTTDPAGTLQVSCMTGLNVPGSNVFVSM